MPPRHRAAWLGRLRLCAAPAIALTLSLPLLGGCSPEPAPELPRWDGLACEGLPQTDSITTSVQHYDTFETTDDAWVRMLATVCWDVRDSAYGALESMSTDDVRLHLLEALGATELFASRRRVDVRWAEATIEPHPELARTVYTLMVEDPWFGVFPVQIGVPDREPRGVVLVHPGHAELDAEQFFVRDFIEPGWGALAEDLVTVGVGQLDYRNEEAEQLVSSALHVLGTSKWAVHLWRGLLAHDLAEQLGLPPVGAIGHSMGGILALLQGIVDHRIQVAHGDASFSNLCLNGPALLDATPGLHAAGIFGLEWSPELSKAVPTWMESEYGQLDPLGFLDAVRAVVAEPDGAVPRDPVYLVDAATFVQVPLGELDVPRDILDPEEPGEGVTRALRFIDQAQGALSSPGRTAMPELLGAWLWERFDAGLTVGCADGDGVRDGLAWSPEGWGARSFRIVRPTEAPRAIVAVVPSWSRTDERDALAVADRVALEQGALVLVLPRLLPGQRDGLGGVVLTSGVESMGASVIGVAAHQLTAALDWARGAVPGGADLPVAVLTEGRSEAFLGAAVAWMDPRVAAVVWEERSVRGLIEANFAQPQALDGLRWFHPWDGPELGFGRTLPGTAEALQCPASHDWLPGLGDVDLDGLYAELAPQLVLAPGLVLADSEAPARVAEALAALR